MGADEPANGEDVQGGQPRVRAGPAVRRRGRRPTARADCEAGQRGFVERQARFLLDKYKVARDPRSPGLQGPTFTGRPRVPKGQTFAPEPETGPYRDLPESEHP